MLEYCSREDLLDLLDRSAEGPYMDGCVIRRWALEELEHRFPEAYRSWTESGSWDLRPYFAA